MTPTWVGEFPDASPDELLLRKLLWLRHGCNGLYGDDGEMQCAKCMLDFRRMGPAEIERRWFELSIKALADAQGAPEEAS